MDQNEIKQNTEQNKPLLFQEQIQVNLNTKRAVQITGQNEYI